MSIAHYYKYTYNIIRTILYKFHTTECEMKNMRRNILLYTYIYHHNIFVTQYKEIIAHAFVASRGKNIFL